MLPQTKQLTVLALTASLVLLSAETFAQSGSKAMFVNMSKGKVLQGEILDLDKIKVNTSFGDVEIPMEKVAGIRLHADKDDNAVIAFANGDIVTGKVELDELQVKTDWGKAFIKSKFIESIMTNRNANFYNDNSTGGWRFSNGAVTQGTTSGGSVRFGN